MQAFDVQSSSSQTLMKTAAQNRERPASQRFRGLKNCGQMVVKILEEKEFINIHELLDLVFNNIDRDCAFADHEKKRTRKNISRSVYNVLSVMESMGIICKNEKIIEWVGFMKDRKQETQLLMMQIEQLETSTQAKLEELATLRSQLLGYKALLKTRNGELMYNQRQSDLPFLPVKTSKETSIKNAGFPAIRNGVQNC